MASLILYQLPRRWETAFKISFCHHLHVAIYPFILGVSGSFVKIERNATIEWCSSLPLGFLFELVSTLSFFSSSRGSFSAPEFIGYTAESA